MDNGAAADAANRAFRTCPSGVGADVARGDEAAELVGGLHRDVDLAGEQGLRLRAAALVGDVEELDVRAALQQDLDE